MKQTVVTAKSVDEAVQIALQQLNATIGQVQVNVLEQPVKGLFGLIGSKEAKVEVIKNADAVEDAVEFLRGLAGEVNIQFEYEVERKGNEATIHLQGEQVGFWIGRRGQMLDSLQYLVNIVVNKSNDHHVRITLDAEDFRNKRRQTLESLADKLAERVIRTRKDVVLEPMNSLERKIIHFQLQDHPRVRTFSKGEEPNRRIVISLKD